MFADDRSARGTRFIKPIFGPTCVCCSAATQRTQLYDPSTDRIQADPIAVPVCVDCRAHAMVTPTVPIMLACAFLLGGVIGGLGIYRASVQPQHATIMIAIGATLFVAGVAWSVAMAARTRRWRRAGHHPGLTMSVTTGQCVLGTTNVALVDELVTANPFSRRRPGSGGRGQVPAARVVSGAAGAPDALTPEEKARLLAEALGKRPPGGSSRRDPR